MDRDDYIIVAGDFGGVWADTPEENYWLDWLEQRPFTTLFVDGNHENFDRLNTFPVHSWHGGHVHQIRPHLLHLMRGQFYNISGKPFFTMGGAKSHDVEDGILDPDDPLFDEKFRRLQARGAAFRVNHRSWWKEELPAPEEYQEAKANLEQVGWSADYIVTHCAPTSIQKELLRSRSTPDVLTDFLEETRQRCRFRYWFFGHYHDNGIIRERFVLLSEQMIRVK